MMAASASKLAEQNVRVIVMRALYKGDFPGRGIFTQNLRTRLAQQFKQEASKSHLNRCNLYFYF
jgi:hypothetical protein